VLGGDARSRAQARLNLQREYETNPPAGMHVMMTDDATRLIDQQELNDRANVLTRVQAGLQQAGMTPQGAAQVAEGMAHGIIPKEYIDGASLSSKVLAGQKEAMNHFAESLPTGRHWAADIETFSASDIEALKKIGGRVGVVGSLIDLGTGIYEWQHGTPFGEVAAKAGGGMAGAWMGGQAGAGVGGMAGGPPGAFIGALIGGTAGAFGGDWVGKEGYKWLIE
jgi:hypothetical protein